MKKNSRFGKLGIIIANSHRELGLKVAAKLGASIVTMDTHSFPNKELEVRRLGDVSGMDICIFSSLYADAGYNTIKELEMICDSVKGSASRIFGVFPFVRDGKSDHFKRYGETVAYKRAAMDISSSGLEVIAVFDQHSSQHPSFYDTTHYQLKKVHHLYLMRILIEYAMKHKDSFDSVLALDEGGFKRNAKIAEMLNKDVSFTLKHRDSSTREVDIEKSRIIGNVSGHRVAAFDDMLQKGTTLKIGALIAKHKGAKEVNFFVVHNDFTPETFDVINPLLESGVINKIYILETIPLKDKERWHKNLIVISPEDFLVEVIRRIHEEGHMRELFLEIT